MRFLRLLRNFPIDNLLSSSGLRNSESGICSDVPIRNGPSPSLPCSLSLVDDDAAAADRLRIRGIYIV